MAWLLLVLGALGWQARAGAEVLDDFSGPGLAAAWRAPRVEVVTGMAGSLVLDGTSYPGELAISGNVTTGSQNFFYITRADRTLGVGEVLRLKLRGVGLPQGAIYQDYLGIGLNLHPAEGVEQPFINLNALNDTRMVVNNGGTYLVTPNTWQVDQPLQLFVQRAGPSTFRCGYIAGTGAFKRVGGDFIVPASTPPAAGAIDLFLNWDERAGKAAGRILLDELAVVENPGFPGGELTPVAIPARYGFPGDLIHFDGSRSQGFIRSYAWRFDEPVTTRTLNAGPVGAQVFSTTGTHPVVLTLTHVDGSTATVQTTATILATPLNERPMPLRGIITGARNDVNAFANPQAWEATFSSLQQIGLNVAMPIHAHPYPYFLRIPGYPEANSDVSDAVLAARRAAFEDILARARNHGIKLYFLVYNIYLSDAFAAAHGLPTTGQNFNDTVMDSALTRAYTKAAIKQFLEAFPDVGLCVTVGETPLYCVDFVRNTMVAAMQEVSGPPRSLMVRDQGLFPDEIRQLTAGLPAGSWMVMSKFTEEQLLPGDGYRGREFTQTLGVRNCYLQSRNTDEMFIGSFQFAQEACRELARDHALGMVIASDSQYEWILLESFARYLQNPERPLAEELVYWAARIRQQYGAAAPAEGFLRAGEAATRILPFTRSLLFYRNNNYKAQYGLPLISFLGMPSVTSYQATGITRPQLEDALTWWLPRGARHQVDLLTVREHVQKSYISRAAFSTTPDSVAEELDRLAARAFVELPALKAYTATVNASQYANSVKLIEFMGWMGKFYAAKLRAAIAWQRWAAGQGELAPARDAVLAGLAESLYAYNQAIAQYEGVFGSSNPGSFLMAAQNNQPPWAGDQNFHGSVTGGMRELSRVWQTEIKVMRARLAAGDTRLPYFTELQAQTPATYQAEAGHWTMLE